MTLIEVCLNKSSKILKIPLHSRSFFFFWKKFINDIDNFEGDFSPISQFNGNIILFKDSRSFQKEYLKSFGGKSISASDFNKPDGIHQFYKKNEHDFQNDNFVVIKAKVR